MESLVGRSQNVAAIIERKKKNKKAFFISAGIIILAAVLLGAIYNYYINIKYNGYKIEERSSIKNKKGERIIEICCGRSTEEWNFPIRNIKCT